MTDTPLDAKLLTRIAAATRYVVSGVAPNAWFGPMQPLAPMAPPEVAGRRFDYPTGYNLDTKPRSYEPVSFGDLRALADSCDILRSVIETRKDQIEAQDWTINVKAVNARTPQPSDDQKRRIDAILSFLHCPDGEHGFDQWLRLILEDMFVIDGVAVYKRRNRAGGLYALEVIDAATIKLLMDDTGRLPASPDPAYQQVLKGVPAADYTRDELMYLVHNPRSHKVYGYSHVEQVLVSVNILIRRSLHQLEYYREGSTPDALIGLPKEWTSEQIGSFQKHFDAMLSGNLGLRRRVRFMPGDFKYQETKAPPLKDAYDEFLARIVCFVFSISPEPFVGQVNRATAESSQARATDEGLAPLMRFVRGFMNRLIAQEFGSPDLEFAWTEQRAQDPMEAAQIDVAYVGAGVLTVDEVRATLGLAPLPGEQVVTPVAKFNPNHLGTGPGGGRFTTAGMNGTSLGLEPGSGQARRTGIDPKTVAHSALKPAGLASGTQVAADDREAFDILKTWANPATLADHVKRHTADFGIDPESTDATEQYLKQANNFLQKMDLDNLPAIKYPNGGEIGVYEPATNTFGLYKSDGSTITFYKPTSPTYFERETKDVISRGGNILNSASDSAKPAESSGGNMGSASVTASQNSSVAQAVESESPLFGEAEELGETIIETVRELP